MSDVTEIPQLWYYTVAGDVSRAWSARDAAWLTTYPAQLVRDFPTAAALTDYLRTHGVRGPAPNDDDARDEYLRRLVLLLEARSVGHAGFIRADDVAERAALRAVVNPTAEQTTRLAELDARETAVAALIDAYNLISSPPPVDYASDSYWPQP